MKIGIAGAGIAGRMLAWRLTLAGHQITLFDKNERSDQSACSFAAAGILSPLAELEMAEPSIYQLGCRSMELYPKWLVELKEPVFFKQIGSLVAAHTADKVELQHFLQMITSKTTTEQQQVESIALSEKEPELKSLGQGLYIPMEGQIDPVALLHALQNSLQSAQVEWREKSQVSKVSPYQIIADDNLYEFDWVFDCRGLGAREGSFTELNLRGVRGELLWLEAPDVSIEHLTRLLHPRYRIYIVPRPENVYLVGATEIESEDFSALSVRSSLELLSAAYSLHKGFGEARIIKSVVNCRPALADNLPKIHLQAGYGEINGLYRHGILLSPAVVEQLVKQFEQQCFNSMNNQNETYDAVNC